MEVMELSNMGQFGGVSSTSGCCSSSSHVGSLPVEDVEVDEPLTIGIFEHLEDGPMDFHDIPALMKVDLYEDFMEDVWRKREAKNPGSTSFKFILPRIEKGEKLDEILRSMLGISYQMCGYCRTSMFIAVDRRQLLQHLFGTHKWRLGEGENVSKLRGIMLNLFKQAFEEFQHPFEVFRYWRDGIVQNVQRRWLECNLCNRSLKFKGPPEFYAHWVDNHPGKEVKCNMCGAHFVYAGSYLNHRCVGTITPLFANKEEITFDNTKDAELLYYDCEYCPERKPFPSFFNFFMHYREFHNGCEGCCRIYETPEKLRAHREKKGSCLSMQPTCWKCPGLEYAYYNHETLRDHQFLVHVNGRHGKDELTIKCDHCLEDKLWYSHNACMDTARHGVWISLPEQHRIWGIVEHDLDKFRMETPTCKQYIESPFPKKLENVNPSKLEEIALDAVRNPRNTTNPFYGMTKSDIFHHLQENARPTKGLGWCIRYWWRASSAQHLLMSTRNVLTLKELAYDAAKQLEMDLDLSESDDEEVFKKPQPVSTVNGHRLVTSNGYQHGIVSATATASDLYCVCKEHRPTLTMWQCENKSCPQRWFHDACVIPRPKQNTNEGSYCFNCSKI